MEDEKTKTEPAYYVGTHRYSFRPGKPAEIIGVVIGTPDTEGALPRPCLVVRYPDGVEDSTPIENLPFYEIISGTDVMEGRIPEVIH